MIHIPARFRTAWYWLVVVVAAGVVVASAFGLVPPDAAERGAAYGGQLVALITALLAVFNIKPDNETEEYMAPYVEDYYKDNK